MSEEIKDETSQNNQLEAQTEDSSIYNEYMMLLAGKRVPNRRRAQPTVTELNKQMQLDQIKKAERKKRDKKEARKTRKKDKAELGRGFNPEVPIYPSKETPIQVKAQVDHTTLKRSFSQNTQSQPRHGKKSYDQVGRPYTAAKYPKSSVVGAPHDAVKLVSEPKDCQSATTAILPQKEAKLEVKNVPVFKQPTPKKEANNPQHSSFEKTDYIAAPLTSKRSESPMVSQSPTKIVKSTKDFIDQLKDFKLLDKVVPAPQFLVNCYVWLQEQHPQQFGRVLKVSSDYLTATVELLADKSQKTVQLSKVKYCARAYSVSIHDLDQDKIPQELRKIIHKKVTSETVCQLILMQVIYLRVAQEGEIDWHNQGGQSSHRLHALVPSKEGFQLYPVVVQRGARRKGLMLNQPEAPELQAKEMKQYCYSTADITKQVLRMARKVQGAFKNHYINKAERYQLTKSNIEKNLLSICSFFESVQQEEGSEKIPVSRSAKAKYGILLRIKQEQNKCLAFFRLFQSKTTQKERVEWVNVDKTTIQADLTLGFVQQSFLNQQLTHEPTSSLKFTKLKMLTWAESQAERAALLRHDQKFEVRVAELTHGTKEETCKKCKYVTASSDFKVLECSKCSSKFHEKCLKDFERNISQCEQAWRCYDCIRCTNCLSSEHKDQQLVCRTCNSAYHYDCLDSSFKNRIRFFPQDSESQQKQTCLVIDDFKCESCISCTNCGRKEAGNTPQNKWSRDFKLCSDCNKKKELKMFCPVCEKFWPNWVQEPGHEQMQSKDPMIQCGVCCMQVHVQCDRMLSDKAILEKFLPSNPEDDKSKLMYSCSACRQKSRCDFLTQLTDVLIAEDKKGDFLDPFWEITPHPTYLNVIRKPICFSKVKDQIEKYLLQPHQYKADIERIFLNARNFNPLQSDIHKSAIRLHEKCNMILSQGRLWEIIETNGKASHDEQLYAQWCLNKVKTQDDTLIAPTDFKLKKKELFQTQEQIDPKNFGIKNRSNSRPSGDSMEVDTLENPEKKSTAVDPQRLKELLQMANKRLLITNINPNMEQADFLNNFPMHSVSSFGNSKMSEKRAADVLERVQPAPYPYSNSFFQSGLDQQSQLAPKEQWKQLIDDLRTNDDRDSCWYSNPVKISFDDPALIFEEMCYLCGAFGNSDDFLCCNLCGESFHPFCLPYPKEGKDKYQDYWLCYNCIFCSKCHSSKQWEGLLICAVCDKVDHFWCLEPQLIQVPACNWKCPDCFKCQSCGTRSFFSEKDIENQANLDPNEKYVLSFDFEFCYQCGQDEYRKSICNICDQKTGLGAQIASQSDKRKSSAGNSPTVKATPTQICEEKGLFKCSECGFYSHLTCSRTSLQSLCQIADILSTPGEQLKPADVYKCIDCLLVNKLPSFFIKMQCETYLNIHYLNERQNLLGRLSLQILSKYVPNETQAEFLIEQFLIQNQKFFKDDSLINQWLNLLESDVQMDQLSTEVSSNQNEERHSPEADQPLNSECFNLKEVIQTQKPEPSELEKLDRYLGGSQQGFLPDQQDLYQSLRQNWTRHNKQEHFYGLDELAEKITVPTEDNLRKVDFMDIFTKIEVRAVIKIRLQFFKWFENLVQNTFVNKQKFKQAALKPPTPAKQDNFDQAGDLIAHPPVNQLEWCTEPDALVDNPQKRLQCILCKLNGERKVTGRLIPYQINQFVHVNCALWTQEVQEGQEENIVCSELYNFHFAYNMFKHTVCALCNKDGASLFCSNSKTKKCSVAYHFPCAYQSKKVSFQRNTDIYCEQCSQKMGSEVQPGLPIEFRDYPKRRIIIVKNLKPQCTNAFQSQIKKLGAGSTPIASLPATPGEPVESQPQQEALDLDDPQFIQTNKWKPYYYDMFNRTGNLTVLSLGKKKNAIIENLHTYKNKSNTWHFRLKRKFPEEDFTDFATVRIYWNYSDGHQGKSPPKDKTYFLFSDEQATKLSKQEFQPILKVLSRRIKEVQETKIKKILLNLPKPIASSNYCVPFSTFWKTQINNLKQRYSNFCQENTYLTVQMIAGLEKYPIQFWNQPGEKEGLELKEINVASFFYKSAYKVLESQRLLNQETTPKQQFCLAKNASTNPNLGGKTATTLDSLFGKMLQANKVTDESSNQLMLDLPGGLCYQTKEEISTRHITYEQLMSCIGKKTLKVKMKERKEQQNNAQENIDNQDDSQSFQSADFASPITHKRRGKRRGKGAHQEQDIVSTLNMFNSFCSPTKQTTSTPP